MPQSFCGEFSLYSQRGYTRVTTMTNDCLGGNRRWYLTLADSPCTSALYQDAHEANTRSHAWLLDARWRMLRTLAPVSAAPKPLAPASAVADIAPTTFCANLPMARCRRDHARERAVWPDGYEQPCGVAGLNFCQERAPSAARKSASRRAGACSILLAARATSGNRPSHGHGCEHRHRIATTCRR